jgi:DNA-binding protein YbaB
MIFKKILLIITFLAVFGWLFGGNIQTTKAQTMEELSAQVSALQTKIAEYQKEAADLQIRISTIQNEIIKLRTEMAKLLGKQISTIQNQIAQLQRELLIKKLAKPESECKCPDINLDGIADMKDITLVSGKVGTCLGNTNYDSKADVDGDNCITSADLDYVTKYFGKKTEEITQCKGVVIVKPLAKPESECKCPDINLDGIADMKDITLVSGKVGTCLGNTNYDPKADVDGDNCITSADLDYVNRYFGKKTGEIVQCKVPLAKPESECKCPDINLDGIADMKDITLVSGKVGTCLGNTNYDPKADVDGDNCVTSADLDYVTKYFGKKTGEIAQCSGVPTLSVIISSNPSSATVPLTGVDLTANVSGTATGSFNYTFYCNRSDTGTNITTGWCQKKNDVIQTSYTATNCCDFSSAGTYTAKVIVERGTLQAEARVNIQANLKPEAEWKCPDINLDGIADMKDITLVSGKVGTCLGNTNYDPKADVDGNNCITSADLDYVTKYFGKTIGDIAQCK